jgi:hypothetical protein
MSVDVDPNASTFKSRTPEKLFETGIRPYGGAYDVIGDGQRFLITTITQERSTITAVLDWTAELQR